ncbi:tRNA preQ1(34) S-adenosylmethionine ribosyltransferase-isomerase QueA, partial [Candidatus Woesearchaeota archaeon]|nr:tRNA preQ1(34) S-adenosylmethionine ribosyltransferase-isomerase QueA [Candidatus Woesearchaeota archaeon]
PQRDQSRLLVLSDNTLEHRSFRDIVNYFQRGDVLVVNDSKVMPARLFGKKETGGVVEVMLLKQKNTLTWECLVKGRATKVAFDTVQGTVSQGNPCTITFSEDITPYLARLGHTPLPPYIKSPAPLERYNTVYAAKEGSVAAPTAGLHFTPEILETIKARGVSVVEVTLHVGAGTFLPVKTENVKDHYMHSEWFSIPQNTADVINTRQGRLFVVGTTTIRALESATQNGKVQTSTGETNIFIHPGYDWKLDHAGLITNFHLPKSTLLILVSAFLSSKRIMEAYHTDIKEKYRFYSFGDAMLILHKM